jgi:hypothetical protein
LGVDPIVLDTYVESNLRIPALQSWRLSSFFLDPTLQLGKGSICCSAKVFFTEINCLHVELAQSNCGRFVGGIHDHLKNFFTHRFRNAGLQLAV